MVCLRSWHDWRPRERVSLQVLSMSGTQSLDTRIATGRLMVAITGAVGQAEREVMLERQRKGIAKAKREGRHKGRVPTARRQGDEMMHQSALLSTNAPHTISAPPARRLTHSPQGSVFSIRIRIARPPIQSRFIKPPTNSNAISTQQQPKQKRP